MSARLDREARGLLADARAYGNLAREAAAMSLLAFAASVAGQLADEAASLSRMVELLDQAGRPWATAAAVTRLGELALRQGQPARPWPGWNGPSRPRPSGRRGAGPRRPPRCCWPTPGPPWARTWSPPGAARKPSPLLTEAIPALGETDFAARARVDLGQAFRQVGDPRSAAEQFALASVGFSAGPDQRAHLLVRVEAARAYAEAAMWPEAQRAYEYARRLGTELGQWAQSRPDPPGAGPA